MATNPGHGVLLKMGDGAGPEVFTTVAQVRGLGFPGLTKALDEFYYHDDAWRRRFATVKDMPAFDVTINYDPANATHGALWDAYIENTLDNYQLVLTDAGAETWEFAAYVQSFAISSDHEAALQAVITLAPDGGPTITA